MDTNKGIFAIFIGLLILAVIMRPSDYAIKREVVKKIVELQFAKKNDRNLNTDDKDFAAGLTWLSIGGRLEIKDYLLFKYYIIHTGRERDEPFGVGVFNWVTTDMIDGNELNTVSETKPSSNTEQIATQKQLNENISLVDSTVKAVANTKLPPRSNPENQGNVSTGSWSGKQEAYNALNSSGEEMLIDGKPVNIPACDWLFEIDSDGNVKATQESLQDHTVALYFGNDGNDFQIAGDVSQLGVTLTSADHKSTLDLTFRFGRDKNSGLCLPSFRNGPNFEIIRIHLDSTK